MNRKDFLTSVWREPIHESNVPNLSEVESDELSLSSYQPSATTSIAAYVPRESKAWDLRRVIHLLRRTNMGATPENVQLFLDWGPSKTVDHIIDNAKKAPKLPKPDWLDKYPPGPEATQKESEEYNMLSGLWSNQLQDGSGLVSVTSGIESKMFLFWHSHFATNRMDYFWPQPGYLYIRLIQDYAFGDFKEFLRRMGLESAMLMYLNNNQNQKGSPNTNYARELLELFTLGEGNGYTEKDIDEIARAITGYVTHTWDVKFEKHRYDDDVKIIFGKSGKFNYDDVINLLFQEKRELIARHLTRKLYRHFIYVNPPESVVNELANVLLEANFVIEPLLRTMLKSEHFFEDEFYGSVVSSPADYLGFIKNTFMIPDEINSDHYRGTNFWHSTMWGIGQTILEPPNVAGWPGHRQWLNTAKLSDRWNNVPYLFFINRLKIWEFARKMSHPNNPFLLAREIAEYLLPVNLSDEDYREMGDILLGGIPAYEWNIYDNGSINRILNLVQHIQRLPEFQLN